MNIIFSEYSIKKIYRSAFTLIEVMVVIIIISTLYLATQAAVGDSARKARETVLKNNIRTVREVISRFYRDNERYPAGIAELVEKKYVVSLPVDPVTERNDTWIIVPSAERKNDMYDIKSGAKGSTLENVPYSNL